MSSVIYNLNFNGYFWQEDLPEQAGLYLTYIVKYNEKTQKYNIDELVYIGETKNIKDRQSQHIQSGDYPTGVKLAFSYALLSGGEAYRKRCEAALIYKIQPVWNTENKQSFNHDTTTINSGGNHYGVPTNFTIAKS